MEPIQGTPLAYAMNLLTNFIQDPGKGYNKITRHFKDNGPIPDGYA
jgi:hypothetical protein